MSEEHETNPNTEHSLSDDEEEPITAQKVGNFCLLKVLKSITFPPNFRLTQLNRFSASGKSPQRLAK